jgi:hypothetical protein
MTPDPAEQQQDKTDTPAGGGESAAGEARPARYDANLRLIRRRLADEKRTRKSRPWWKKA